MKSEGCDRGSLCNVRAETHMLERPWPTVEPTATPAAVDMMLPIMPPP